MAKAYLKLYEKVIEGKALNLTEPATQVLAEEVPGLEINF